MNTIRFADYIINSQITTSADYFAGVKNDITVKQVPSSGGGAYIPLSGTTTGNALTGTIEFSTSSTAIWQNNATGSGFWIGFADNKDISVATTRSAIYFADGNAQLGITDSTTYQQFINFDSGHGIAITAQDISNSTYVEFDMSPTKAVISSGYTTFKGLEYFGGTGSIVTANQTGTSILHRDANDLRYAPKIGGGVLLGKLIGFNMNSTSNQNLTISGGNTYIITDIVITNASVQLTTADGFSLSATGAPGNFVVATATNADLFTLNNDYSFFNSIPYEYDTANAYVKMVRNQILITNNTLTTNITTPEGSSATVDIYVYGYILN